MTMPSLTSHLRLQRLGSREPSGSCGCRSHYARTLAWAGDAAPVPRGVGATGRQGGGQRPPAEHVGGRTPTRDHRGPWPSCPRQRSFLGPVTKATMQAGGPGLAGHTSLLTCLISLSGQALATPQLPETTVRGLGRSPDNPSPALAFPNPAGRCSQAGKRGRSHYCSLSSRTMESSSPFPEPLTPSPPPLALSGSHSPAPTWLQCPRAGRTPATRPWPPAPPPATSEGKRLQTPSARPPPAAVVGARFPGEGSR